MSRSHHGASNTHPVSSVTILAAALAPHGLLLRGGFHPEPDEAGLECAGTVLLIGNAGAAMWDAFAPHQDEKPDPLNRWTRKIVAPLAEEFGARALYPFGEPHWPFQRWARRAETLFPSPLGLLIHPEFGLWHAWRAALLFAAILPLPARLRARNPCESCAEKPCLSACPVGAFTSSGYDVPACATHLAGQTASCSSLGCHARNACPVGRGRRYPEAQIRFHMAAFHRSVIVTPRNSGP